MARGDLTDDEWAGFEPLLPLGERGPLPGLRRLVNGVMWRFRTGGPWRDMPERYGPWSTVYGRFYLWTRSEVFQTLMKAVIAEAAAHGQADLGLAGASPGTKRPGSRAGRAGGCRPRGGTASAPTSQGPAPRRRTGALTRWVDQQGASVGGPPLPPVVLRAQPRPGRRQLSLHRRPGAHQGLGPGRTAPHPPCHRGRG